MWPLMEVLVGKKGKHQIDVEYRVKGKDLVSYKYSGTDATIFATCGIMGGAARECS